MRSMPVLHGKQHDRSRTQVMLPGQHKVDQKGHKRRGQQSLTERPETPSENFGPVGAGSDSAGLIARPARVQTIQRFYLLAEALDYLPSSAGVFRYILQKRNGLVR